MRIKNDTDYDTESLRALFSAGLKANEARSNGLDVYVVYARSNGVSGHASIGRWKSRFVPDWRTHSKTASKPMIGSVPHTSERVFQQGMRVTMRIPKPTTEFGGSWPHSTTWEEALSLRVARVWEHEVKHLMGLRHKDMSNTLYRCRQEVPWATGIVLRLATVVVKAKETQPSPSRTELARVRSEKARARAVMKVAEWTKKSANARKQLVKWEHALKLIERKLGRAAVSEVATSAVAMTVAAGSNNGDVFVALRSSSHPSMETS